MPFVALQTGCVALQTPRVALQMARVDKQTPRDSPLVTKVPRFSGQNGQNPNTGVPNVCQPSELWPWYMRLPLQVTNLHGWPRRPREGPGRPENRQMPDFQGVILIHPIAPRNGRICRADTLTQRRLGSAPQTVTGILDGGFLPKAATRKSECRRGNGARGAPCEIRRRQWEALARGIISQGSPSEIRQRQMGSPGAGIISQGKAHDVGR